jgi:Asp/Glu/hydantoin racemase
MRVLAITPIHVDADELERRRRRYQRLAPPGVSVHLDDLGDGPEVPRALDTVDDIRRSEGLVTAQIRRTNPGEYDAVLPDCVLDPGVDAGGDLPVRVFGILQLSAHLLAATGERLAAVARNDAIANELARKAASYGLGGQLTGVRVLGLEVADIADDAAWAGAISRAADGIDAAVVINGCSAVDVAGGGGGPRVVDPTATALRVLGLLADLGLASASRPTRTALSGAACGGTASATSTRAVR